MNRAIIVALLLLAGWMGWHSHQYLERVAEAQQEQRLTAIREAVEVQARINLLEQTEREMTARYLELRAEEMYWQREVERLERERVEFRIRTAERIRALKERAGMP